jgi:hypothetical protein
MLTYQTSDLVHEIRITQWKTYKKIIKLNFQSIMKNEIKKSIKKCLEKPKTTQTNLLNS